MYHCCGRFRSITHVSSAEVAGGKGDLQEIANKWEEFRDKTPQNLKTGIDGEQKGVLCVPLETELHFSVTSRRKI
jgi:hypothetical protein